MTDSKLSWLVISALLLFKVVKNFKQFPTYVYVSLFLVIGAIVYAIISQDSTTGRFLVFKATVSLWTENLLNGIGINQFDSQYNLFQADFLQKQNSPSYNHLASYVEVAYNDFLQIVLETGLFGLSFIALSLILIYKNIKLYPYHIKEAILVIVLIALFSFPFQTSSSVTLCIVYFALFSSFHNPVKEFYIRSTLLKAACIMAIGFILFLSFKTQNALYIWKLSNKNPDITNQKNFADTYRVLSNNKDFQLSYANQLYLQNRYNESIQVLERASFQSSKVDIYLLLAVNYESIENFPNAEKNYKKSIRLVPSLLKPKFLLMKLYLKRRRLEEAKQLAKLITQSRLKVKTPESTYIINMANKVIQL